MNLSATIFLINDKARAVKCKYDDAPGEKEYVFKTMDPTVVKGDFLVVPSGTRVGFTVVKVIETDVDVDYDGAVQYKWGVKFDKAAYDAIVAGEEQMIQAVRQAETRRKREELRKTMFADQEALAGLPMVDLSALPKPE